MKFIDFVFMWLMPKPLKSEMFMLCVTYFYEKNEQLMNLSFVKFSYSYAMNSLNVSSPNSSNIFFGFVLPTKSMNSGRPILSTP